MTNHAAILKQKFIGTYNDTDYALTGGVYSRTPSHIERASRDFELGNFYINRGTPARSQF